MQEYDPNTRIVVTGSSCLGKRLTIGLKKGDVAELADALDLGSSLARGAGSIPVIPIRFPETNYGMYRMLSD